MIQCEGPRFDALSKKQTNKRKQKQKHIFCKPPFAVNKRSSDQKCKG